MLQIRRNVIYNVYCFQPSKVVQQGQQTQQEQQQQQKQRTALQA